MEDDTCLIDIVTNMKLKFNKYWDDCNLLICIATILDNRNKMQTKIAAEEVRHLLRDNGAEIMDAESTRDFLETPSISSVGYSNQVTFYGMGRNSSRMRQINSTLGGEITLDMAYTSKDHPRQHVSLPFNVDLIDEPRN